MSWFCWFRSNICCFFDFQSLNSYTFAVGHWLRFNITSTLAPLHLLIKCLEVGMIFHVFSIQKRRSLYSQSWYWNWFHRFSSSLSGVSQKMNYVILVSISQAYPKIDVRALGKCFAYYAVDQRCLIVLIVQFFAHVYSTCTPVLLKFPASLLFTFSTKRNAHSLQKWWLSEQPQATPVLMLVSWCL